MLAADSNDGEMLASHGSIGAILYTPIRIRHPHVINTIGAEEELKLMEGLIRSAAEGKVERYPNGVARALREGNAEIVIANDKALGLRSVKSLIKAAIDSGTPVRIFSADDLMGVELRKMGNVACITKKQAHKRKPQHSKGIISILDQLLIINQES